MKITPGTIKKLYKYMSENPDIYAYFYDSY